ncbi:MAG: SDR family NAD(P)-dependent oxidoreductase, partial [Muribaculaceae bacterium]|nr:SDR family NAD(P)-dependent oxidoreductase [Muribaculaceae bacterium]
MSRRIVIIGASSGIGLKSALYFADKGWKVGIAARRASQLIAVKNQYPQNVEMEVID